MRADVANEFVDHNKNRIHIYVLKLTSCILPYLLQVALCDPCFPLSVLARVSFKLLKYVAAAPWKKIINSLFKVSKDLQF